jgi:16S rRNA (guanine(527)-N(7))-methyltransferase RsmG
MTIVHKDEQHDVFVNFFMAQEQLSSFQIDQFLCYRSLLIEWNEYFNLTAIIDPNRILVDHFQDSLILRRFFDLSTVKGIADVGSGAGFPGMPLAITNKDLSVVLIEVNGKKRLFLEKVIGALELKNVIISSLDWRTFIRKADYPIDLFCARASLRPDELIHVFASDSLYRNTGFFYWAAQNWQRDAVLSSYFYQEYSYINGEKNRKLIYMERVIGSD